MTNREAIHELKMLLTKHRGDFYNDTREALETAINALYGQEEENDERICGNRKTDKRP